MCKETTAGTIYWAGIFSTNRHCLLFMASALTSSCDVAVYEQGVWFLRLSAVLLLASFANYVTLPTRDKPVKAPAVAQVEEIKEAVAVAAPSQEDSSVQQGADISVPPIPNTPTQKRTLTAGKSIKNNKREKDARGKKPFIPIRRGVIRKRRRAASHGKPKTTSAGLVSGSNKIVQMTTRQTPNIAAAPAFFQKGTAPVTRSNHGVHSAAKAAVAATPTRSQWGAKEPITISMHPSKIKHLKFSL